MSQVTQTMLRITAFDRPHLGLKLEGRIMGPWVSELRRTWMRVATSSGQNSVRVDLSGVSFVDANGRDLLLEIQKSGGDLVGASGFLCHVLAEDSRKHERI